MQDGNHSATALFAKSAVVNNHTAVCEALNCVMCDTGYNLVTVRVKRMVGLTFVALD